MKYYRLKNEIETVTILYELDRLYQIVVGWLNCTRTRKENRQESKTNIRGHR